MTTPARASASFTTVGTQRQLFVILGGFVALIVLGVVLGLTCDAAKLTPLQRAARDLPQEEQMARAMRLPLRLEELPPTGQDPQGNASAVEAWFDYSTLTPWFKAEEHPALKRFLTGEGSAEDLALVKASYRRNRPRALDFLALESQIGYVPDLPWEGGARQVESAVVRFRGPGLLLATVGLLEPGPKGWEAIERLIELGRKVGNQPATIAAETRAYLEVIALQAMLRRLEASGNPAADLKVVQRIVGSLPPRLEPEAAVRADFVWALESLRRYDPDRPEAELLMPLSGEADLESLDGALRSQRQVRPAAEARLIAWGRRAIDRYREHKNNLRRMYRSMVSMRRDARQSRDVADLFVIPFLPDYTRVPRAMLALEATRLFALTIIEALPGRLQTGSWATEIEAPRDPYANQPARFSIEADRLRFVGVALGGAEPNPARTDLVPTSRGTSVLVQFLPGPAWKRPS